MKFFDYGDSVPDSCLLSPWSLMHFNVGIVSTQFLKIYTNLTIKENLLLGLLFHTFYEIKDIVKSCNSKSKDKLKWGNDSLLNSLGDTLCFMLGQYIVIKYSNKLPSFKILFIIFSILCLYLKFIKTG